MFIFRNAIHRNKTWKIQSYIKYIKLLSFLIVLHKMLIIPPKVRYPKIFLFSCGLLPLVLRISLFFVVGVRTMAKAYATTPTNHQKESLSNVKCGYKECTQVYIPLYLVKRITIANSDFIGDFLLSGHPIEWNFLSHHFLSIHV